MKCQLGGGLDECLGDTKLKGSFFVITTLVVFIGAAGSAEFHYHLI